MKLRGAVMMTLLGGSSFAPAQQGFMVHLDSIQAGRNGGGVSVRGSGDGYLLFCGQFSHDGTGRIHVYTRWLNEYGQYMVENEFTYGDDRDYEYGRIDPVAYGPDGTYVAVVPEGWSYGDSTWLYTFNGVGERIGRKFLFAYDALDSVTHSIKQVRSTTNGGYALGGFQSIMSTTSRASLALLDTQGDTLWTRRYGQQGQAWVAVGVDEYPGGGFVLSGYRSGPIDNNFLILTDADGTQQWVRYTGGHGVQNGGQTGGVKVTSDGGIVTWAYHRENGWPAYHNQLMLTKWDAQGGIVWQRKSHYGYYRFAFDLEVLPDGSFIASAFGADAGLNAMLCKFNSTGDSLWTRGYQVTHGQHFTYDVEPTSDGGFVATGVAWRQMPIDSNFQQTQTIWVVKTDSLGCVVPGCHTVGVEEYALDLNEYLRIHPNPVARGQALHISFTPPPAFTPNGPLRAVVLDATGRQVHEGTLRGPTGTPASPAGRLTTDNWQPGLHYLHLTDGKRWLAGGKVIVQ